MRQTKCLALMTLMMCSTLWVLSIQALEPDERTHFTTEFSQTADVITDTSQRLLVSLRQIEVTPFATITDKIKARQDQARDWAKRIADPATNFSVEEVEPPLDVLRSLNNQLEHIIEFSDQIINAPNAWPQSMSSPAFIRYVSFMRARVDNALNAVAAGTESPEENNRFWQVAHLHRLLLGTIESLTVAPTNWPSLPTNAPVMEAYNINNLI